MGKIKVWIKYIFGNLANKPIRICIRQFICDPRSWITLNLVLFTCTCLSRRLRTAMIMLRIFLSIESHLTTEVQFTAQILPFKAFKSKSWKYWRKAHYILQERILYNTKIRLWIEKQEGWWPLVRARSDWDTIIELRREGLVLAKYWLAKE